MRWWAALVVSVLLTASAPAMRAHAECAAQAGQLDCDFADRITAATTYLADRPGTVGFVLRDRATGAVYRNASAATMIWSASTIKLAIAVDLLTRNGMRSITLTPADQQLMQKMIHSSDNAATDTLWSRYGGADHQDFNRDFPAYGMTDLAPQQGFSDIFPYWGFQKTTADDLDRLMTYVLTKMAPLQTAALVNEMQNVDPDQQWGVWGAGQAMAPGNKNGWSQEQGGWVVNSVGFAGPRQRYTLAVMNALGGAGGYDDGVETTTHLATLLLSRRTS